MLSEEQRQRLQGMVDEGRKEPSPQDLAESVAFEAEQKIVELLTSLPKFKKLVAAMDRYRFGSDADIEYQTTQVFKPAVREWLNRFGFGVY